MTLLSDQLAEQFQQHAASLPGAGKTRVADFRREAFTRFEKMGLPTVRQEDWKYTDIRSLRESDYVALGAPEPIVSNAIKLSDLPLPIFSTHVAVFLDGKFDPNLSSLDALPCGVTCTTIGDLLTRDSDEFAPFLNQFDSAFPALNCALIEDGMLVQVAAGVNFNDPIQVLYVNTVSPGARLNSARLIISASANSAVTVIESHASLEGSTSATNALTEIDAQAGANVAHYRIQMDDALCHHIGNVYASVANDASVSTYSFAFGGAITRIDVNADLVGRGAHVTMNGLFMVNDGQHIDHHTRVRHKVGNTTSSESYKGIADGNGRGVFNGKILVEQDAQKIEALQSSKNLLLSDNAEIDTKPELEIYADDVKCAHGATVGQLDEDSFFYLRSRGIDEQTARSILTFAFAADIAVDITVAPLREWLEEIITTRTHTTGINEIEDRG
ncbi:MAG: Fe-S cluster assembly protein SufD [Gammaproteobacteria bacterium]|jgi:Fe-S cluster assembly protein SufD